MGRISAVLAVLLGAVPIWADGPRVIEPSTRVVVENDASVVELEIAADQPARANLVVEWVDPKGKTSQTAGRDLNLNAGRNPVRLPLALDHATLWERLHYRLNAGGAAQEGWLALTGIAQHVFSGALSQSRSPQPGGEFPLRFFATNPASGKPVADVAVTAAVKYDKLRKTVSVRGATDANGLAILHAMLPPDAPEGPIEIRISAHRADFSLTISQQSYLWSDSGGPTTLSVVADKPIYQPGQTVHFRSVAFDGTRHAVANAEVIFEVKDPADTLLYRKTAKTSRFGVSTTDWTIPSNLRLGDYQVAVQMEDGQAQAAEFVKVSRYELPQFTVAAKPDRSYYLTGQAASIEVRADYLFGKPLAHGRVRLVREENRRWNYAEQEWDVTEHETYEGVTNAAGIFTVKLKPEAFAGTEWESYYDLDFAAYVTDPATGHTEQKRFGLRLARHAIQVYWTQADEQAYVSASYADGAPAECDVAVSVDKESPSIRVHTNRYGVARVPAPPGHGQELILAAADGRGASGESRQPYQPQARTGLTIHTDHAIYRTGESIVLDIHSAVPDRAVAVETHAGDLLLAATAVTLHEGQARVTLPYLPAYQREVQVTVHAGSAMSTVTAARSVLYPSAAGIKLDLQLSKPVYAPGEDASAAIGITDEAGKPVESALGVVITDKAVELRANSMGNAPLFRPPGFWDGCFWGLYYFDIGQQEVAGISLSDLLHLAQPASPDLDLVAELLLADRPGYDPGSAGYPGYGTTQAMDFGKLVESEFTPLNSALGNQIFPRNADDLTRMTAAKGVNWRALRDPWGMPYRVRFRLERERFLVEFLSSGPDKRFDTEDDFVAKAYPYNYFFPLQQKIGQALKSADDVRDERAFQALLRQSGITSDQFRDPLGRPYQVKIETYGAQRVLRIGLAGADETTRYPLTLAYYPVEYFRNTRIQMQKAVYTADRFPRTEAEFRRVLQAAGLDFGSLRDAWGRPYSVTFKQDAIYGHRVEPPSGATGTRTVTPITVQRLTIAIQSAGPDGKTNTGDDFAVASFSHVINDQAAGDRSPVKRPGGRAAADGAIAGVVSDPTGAAIPRAQIRLQGNETGAAYTGTTDESGSYYVSGLVPGIYELTVASQGFRAFRAVDVVVASGTVTNIDATLQVGSTTESVMVQSIAETVNTESAAGAKSTPRLREYFPETLLWQPLLETGPDGRARLQFKLADNLTTWKMSVMGSTADGRIATAETEFKAFQPFFVDLETPATLTQGDRVSLPAVVRNYLTTPQKVDASLAAQTWIEALGPASRKLEIAPGETATAVFPVRAAMSLREGRSRITATSPEAGDAIERVVAVHPDGQERTATAADAFHTKTELTVSIAGNAVAGSLTGELRIYPNLIAHVLESLAAVLQRPWGCAEQTISSAYPSIYALRLLQSLGIENQTAREARQNVELGYQRLLRFQHEGGFVYFTGQGTDIALTAYALEFLNDAAGLVEVDEPFRQSVVDWLVKQQRPDGSWQWRWAGNDRFGQHRVAVLTATVAHALAAASASRQNAAAGDALQRAFAFLSKTTNDEPYLLASYALAAFDSGDPDRGRELLARLRSLARPEGSASFWGLGFCTPYYGWGSAGGLEVTGLVLRALARAPEYRDVTARAVQFLLRHQDRYGIWYTSQATRQVLAAIVAFSEASPPGGGGPQQAVEILVNGKAAGKVEIPPSAEASGMIPVDISRFLAPGENRVELRGSPSQMASAQVVADYYVPWTKQSVEPVVVEDSRLLLGVAFDRHDVRLGESVTCKVKAQRVGSQGFGMMIAEIGLPPGSEVDRESIASGYYELMPDRVVFYLWPEARGTEFSFRFRPRLGMEAKSAPSRLYDYYNPDLRTETEPVAFKVR